MLERGWLVGAGIVLCLSAAIARADSNNPNLLPLGEYEPYLGNTGIGRPNDTGAVYYNPSGLAELAEDRISVSGAAYLHFETHADTFLNIDNTNIPFNASGFITIPFLYAATRRIGDWVGALSVLVPETLTLDNSVPFDTTNTKGNTIYSQNNADPFRSTDIRDVYGTVLKHWFNMTQVDILSGILPVDMLGDPNLRWMSPNFDLGFV